jgi:hypothetical protein
MHGGLSLIEKKKIDYAWRIRMKWNNEVETLAN